MVGTRYNIMINELVIQIHAEVITVQKIEGSASRVLQVLLYNSLSQDINSDMSLKRNLFLDEKNDSN